MEVAASIVVKGMVQGVGFRYYVFTRAVRIGLRGYVANLYNGDVEIEAEGERSLIEELLREVRVGPRAAHVADVAVNWKTPERRYQGFEIR